MDPRQAKIAEAAALLRSAGWRVSPPTPPRMPPGSGSWYRSIVADIAFRRYGWRGGSNPERLLSEAEKVEASRRAEVQHAHDLTKPVFGGNENPI